MFNNSQSDIRSSFLDDNINMQPSRESYGLEYTDSGDYNTLRESIFISLKREFVRIWNKLQFAVVPRFSSNPQQNLRQWDLWGPLFFTILLS